MSRGPWHKVCLEDELFASATNRRAKLTLAARRWGLLTVLWAPMFFNWASLLDRYRRVASRHPRSTRSTGRRQHCWKPTASCCSERLQPAKTLPLATVRLWPTPDAQSYPLGRPQRPICRRRLNDWQSGRSSRRARPRRSGRKADGSGRRDIDLVHVDRPHLQTRAVDRYDCYVKCNPPSARTTSPVR